MGGIPYEINAPGWRRNRPQIIAPAAALARCALPHLNGSPRVSSERSKNPTKTDVMLRQSSSMYKRRLTVMFRRIYKGTGRQSGFAVSALSVAIFFNHRQEISDEIFLKIDKPAANPEHGVTAILDPSRHDRH
jgi:hypothetical protein